MPTTWKPIVVFFALTILLLASALGLGAYLLKDLSRAGGIVVLAQAAAVMCVVFLLEWAGRRAD